MDETDKLTMMIKMQAFLLTDGYHVPTFATIFWKDYQQQKRISFLSR
jgi:hypothetical protein